MVYSIGDYALITVSYTFAKIIFASNERLSSYEVYAGRTFVQFLCSQIHMYFVNKNKTGLSQEE